MNEPELIREILETCRTIAVVGLSNHEGRASWGVSHFMQSRGYRIVPVNPMIESALGERAYATLDAALEACERQPAHAEQQHGHHQGELCKASQLRCGNAEAPVAAYLGRPTD